MFAYKQELTKEVKNSMNSARGKTTKVQGSPENGCADPQGANSQKEVRKGKLIGRISAHPVCSLHRTVYR